MNEYNCNRESSIAHHEGADRLENPQDELLFVVWRRWRTVLLCVIVGLAVAYVYLRNAVPQYTSVTRLYVQPEGPRVVSQFEGLGIVLGGSDGYLYTQAELLQSTPLLQAAADKPGMSDLRIIQNTNNPVSAIRGSLEIEVGTRDDIINITFESPYPEESAQVVDAIIAAYIDFHAAKRRSSAAEVLQILQTEKERHDRLLGEKMQAMVDFKRDSGVISFHDDEMNFIHRRLAVLSGELTRVQLAGIEARTLYEAVERLIHRPDVAIRLSDDMFAYSGLEGGDFDTRLREAQSRLVGLRREFTDEHPLVKAALDEVRLLQQQILSSVQERFKLVRQRETEILTLLGQQQKAAEQLGVHAATYAMLESEIRRTEALCEILDGRIKEINVSEGAGTMNITVLEPPRVSDSPASPQKGRVLAIGLLLGVVFGLGAALAHDKFDQRLQTADEIVEASRLPVLGIVPAISNKLTTAERGQLIHIEPASAAAEAFRAIRTAVRFGRPDHEAAVLLITSPTLGEGKSTIASNLAIALAQDRQRTLIIDADFRKPVQHDLFRVDGFDGLTNVLVGEATLDDVIHPTTLSRLDILPCGQIPPNPCEMLSSRIMFETLDTLKERYDRIVIDAPAVTPVADARILASMSDAALIVAQVARSTRTQVRQAVDYLASMNTQLLGVIINNGTPRRAPKNYDYVPCTARNVSGWSSSRRVFETVDVEGTEA